MSTFIAEMEPNLGCWVSANFSAVTSCMGGSQSPQSRLDRLNINATYDGTFLIIVDSGGYTKEDRS